MNTYETYAYYNSNFQLAKSSDCFGTIPFKNGGFCVTAYYKLARPDSFTSDVFFVFRFRFRT